MASSALLVTGAAGFIGSHFVRDFLAQETGETIISLDALTYAGRRENLDGLPADRHQFVHGDITDGALVADLLQRHNVRAIVHFAAESHVDRSISDPEAFIHTNVIGTFRLLEAARAHARARADFRFLHVSTDEVYGTLTPEEAAFTEAHPFAPNSPYAASKASSDHLVRAYFHTYGLYTLTGNCSNNYGPGQFPEKLIPLCIHKALAGEPLPIYGDGRQVRDWLYVGDHCRALRLILAQGRAGETYNIGGRNELYNIDTVRLLCTLLDQMRPRADGRSYAEQIAYVTDRPGHDRRYAIDDAKLERELGFADRTPFVDGLRRTVAHYLAPHLEHHLAHALQEVA